MPYTESLELAAHLKSVQGKVGLDLEADSLYRHSERICLLQVCHGSDDWLVDPLGDVDIQPLVDWAKDAEVWMHGADYDMSLMLREWSFVPPVLYDTQIAAQLLGYSKFGYASLIEQVFEVELSKSSQKADWGKRPLSDKMLEYARNDVRYLLPLADFFEGKLNEKGRYEWFVESCGASRQRVIERDAIEKEPWRINGSGKLKPAGLNFLKSLWEWRDQEAAEWNRPSFMVLGNKTLIEWSEGLIVGRKPTVPPKMRSSRRERLFAAISKASETPESEWPQKPKRPKRKHDPNFESRLAELLENRNKVAAKLELDPSVIASRAVLEGLIINPAESRLLRWQQHLLGLAL